MSPVLICCLSKIIKFGGKSRTLKMVGIFFFCILCFLYFSSYISFILLFVLRMPFVFIGMTMVLSREYANNGHNIHRLHSRGTQCILHTRSGLCVAKAHPDRSARNKVKVIIFFILTSVLLLDEI